MCRREEPDSCWSRHGDDTGFAGEDVKFACSRMDTGSADTLCSVLAAFRQERSDHAAVDNLDTQSCELLLHGRG